MIFHEVITNFINDLSLINNFANEPDKKTSNEDIVYRSNNEHIINKGQIDTSLVTYTTIDRIILNDIECTDIKTWKDALEFVLSYFALHNDSKMTDCFYSGIIELTDTGCFF